MSIRLLVTVLSSVGIIITDGFASPQILYKVYKFNMPKSQPKYQTECLEL